MGFAELLTILFVALKMCGVVTWSWWLVLLPEIIAMLFYITIIIVKFAMIKKQNKTFMNMK